MKIRSGFVSNSSTTSYILYFKQTPTTVDEMRATLFPNGAKRFRGKSTFKIAEFVIDSMQNSKEISFYGDTRTALLHVIALQAATPLISKDPPWIVSSVEECVCCKDSVFGNAIRSNYSSLNELGRIVSAVDELCRLYCIEEIKVIVKALEEMIKKRSFEFAERFVNSIASAVDLNNIAFVEVGDDGDWSFVYDGAIFRNVDRMRIINH